LDFRLSDSYRNFLGIFRRSDDFLANFRKKSWVVGVHIVLLSSLLMLVLLLASLYYFGILVVAGLPFTVFASIPAFDGVHTVLAVLLLLLLLLVFLLLWAVIILMLLVAGVTVVACVTAVLASRLWQAFMLLLASFKFLMVSCCWSLCFRWRSRCN
jgi:hypothetical protein